MHQNEWFQVWFFKKFLGRGSPNPFPRPLSPFFLGLHSRFGLRPQYFGALRIRIGRFAPSIRASPSTFDRRTWFDSPKKIPGSATGYARYSGDRWKSPVFWKARSGNPTCVWWWVGEWWWVLCVVVSGWVVVSLACLPFGSMKIMFTWYTQEYAAWSVSWSRVSQDIQIRSTSTSFPFHRTTAHHAISCFRSSSVKPQIVLCLCGWGCIR